MCATVADKAQFLGTKYFAYLELARNSQFRRWESHKDVKHSHGDEGKEHPEVTDEVPYLVQDKRTVCETNKRLQLRGKKISHSSV